MHLAREHAVHRQVHTLVRHVDQPGAGAQVEELAREVVRGAEAARAEVELARIGARVGDELGQRAGRYRGMRHHDVRHLRHQRDGREVLDRIVVQLGVQRRADRERRRDQHDRVAVRRRARRRLRADVAAGAAAVLGHHRLPERSREAVRDQAAEEIGAAARREGQDEPDRLRRIRFLRERAK